MRRQAKFERRSSAVWSRRWLVAAALRSILAVHAAVPSPAAEPPVGPREEGALEAGEGSVSPAPGVLAAPSAVAARKGDPAKGRRNPTAKTAAPKAEIVWETPAPLPLDTTPRWVPVEPSDRSRSAADAAALKGARVTFAAGRVQVQLSGEAAARELRKGDVVGTDTVVRVEPTRVVLRRPAAPGDKEDATVVLKAGKDGLAWVRVYRVPEAEPPVAPGAAAIR